MTTSSSNKNKNTNTNKNRKPLAQRGLITIQVIGGTVVLFLVLTAWYFLTPVVTIVGTSIPRSFGHLPFVSSIANSVIANINASFIILVVFLVAFILIAGFRREQDTGTTTF